MRSKLAVIGLAIVILIAGLGAFVGYEHGQRVREIKYAKCLESQITNFSDVFSLAIARNLDGKTLENMLKASDFSKIQKYCVKYLP